MSLYSNHGASTPKNGYVQVGPFWGQPGRNAHNLHFYRRFQRFFALLGFVPSHVPHIGPVLGPTSAPNAPHGRRLTYTRQNRITYTTRITNTTRHHLQPTNSHHLHHHSCFRVCFTQEAPLGFLCFTQEVHWYNPFRVSLPEVHFTMCALSIKVVCQVCLTKGLKQT